MSDEQDQGSGWGEINLIPIAGPQQPGAARSGDELSIPFDNLLVRLQGPATSLTGQASLSFEVPFDLAHRRGLHGFLAGLRYEVDKTEGARGLLFIAVGNATKVIEFPYTQKVVGDNDTISAPASPLLQQLFSIEQWPSEAESPQLPPRPPLVVSIVLLGQRQTPADELLLQVETLDLKAISYDGGNPN